LDSTVDGGSPGATRSRRSLVAMGCRPKQSWPQEIVWFLTLLGDTTLIFFTPTDRALNLYSASYPPVFTDFPAWKVRTGVPLPEGSRKTTRWNKRSRERGRIRVGDRSRRSGRRSHLILSPLAPARLEKRELDAAEGLTGCSCLDRQVQHQGVAEPGGRQAGLAKRRVLLSRFGVGGKGGGRW